MFNETHNSSPGTSPGNKLKLAVDLRIIAVLLLVVIAVMFVIWKPWSDQPGANARTIEVRGESTLTAEPDEFVFYPTYEFKNADKAAALTELSSKSDAIVAKLKELGIPENKIKTDSNAYNYNYYMGKPDDMTNTYTLTMTVTLNDKALTQKVQDYLVTTAPTGSVSPQAAFSDAKRKQLENEARTKAVRDAKSKADQSAADLGFKVGKVKAVSDDTGFTILPAEARASSGSAALDSTATPSLGVHPGENELPYAVTVVYFIR